MDEHITVWGGRTVTFNNTFVDHNLHDLSFFVDKHNSYATREAVQRIIGKLHVVSENESVAAGASGKQARIKRIIKERFYNRLPFGTGPLCYFLFRYIIQRGFIDGLEGLIYHFLQGFWYRFLVEAKLLELQRAIRGIHDPMEIKAELTRRTLLTIE